jgi:ABC-type glycerol-3-phosphate transport system substrate-binding protein
MKKMCLFAALALALVMSGCGKKEAQVSGVVEAKTVDYSQHEEFSVWLFADPYDQYNDYSDNPIVWALNRKFNVTLKFEQPVRGTERDAMSLMFGTGEYTDMIEMSNYTGSISQLYEDGVIVDIAEYLDYMPNFKHLLETNEGFRRTCYDDNGRILTLRSMADPEDPELMFSGLLYRHDILESATGGDIRFPSGNDYPKTIDDWEYMLPIFKSYFEGRNVTDYAPLIIPANGYFSAYGELVNSFGGRAGFYLDDKTVKFGPLEEPFYKYLKKMREWYEKGYIYKDFASRVNDMFFLPNTSLTYGGNAGIFYGLVSQIGSGMSNPQHGLNFDVRPLLSPLSTADGVTEFANFQKNPIYENAGVGWAFTKKCENLPKLLSILDYLYGTEGELLKGYGLTKETGSAENPVYVAAGLQDGFYWVEGDEPIVNPVVSTIGNYNGFIGNRLPGVVRNAHPPERRIVYTISEPAWNPYPNAKYPKLPGPAGGGATRTVEEETVFSPNYVRITDYIDSTVPKFIMGTMNLDDAAWADFKAQLKSLGIEENIRIQQAAYDRWLKR